MAFKIRIINRKQELKKPDEFISAVGRLTEITQVYRKRVLTVAGLLVLIGGGIAGGVWYQFKQEELASVLEFEATVYYHQPEVPVSDEEGAQPSREESLRKAIDLYQEVVTRYPRTKSATLSQYYLGNSYLEIGDYDQAVLAYQNFIERYHRFPSLLALVRQRLAYAYLGNENSKAAMESFEEILGSENVFNKSQVLYEMGKLHEVKGENEEAIKQYQKIMDEHPGSLLVAEARVRLRGLGVVEEKASIPDESSQDSSTVTVETPPVDPPSEIPEDNP